MYVHLIYFFQLKHFIPLLHFLNLKLKLSKHCFFGFLLKLKRRFVISRLAGLNYSQKITSSFQNAHFSFWKIYILLKLCYFISIFALNTFNLSPWTPFFDYLTQPVSQKALDSSHHNQSKYKEHGKYIHINAEIYELSWMHYTHSVESIDIVDKI